MCLKIKIKIYRICSFFKIYFNNSLIDFNGVLNVFYLFFKEGDMVVVILRVFFI